MLCISSAAKYERSVKFAKITMRKDTGEMIDSALPYRNSEDVGSLQKYLKDTASTNDEALLRAKNVLSKAIQTELTAKQQEYLLMQFCDGLTVTEISRRCGVDKSVVSRTISRAKRRLYHCIKYAML